MGWNLQNRDVEWRGEVPFIGGAPLRHFHSTSASIPSDLITCPVPGEPTALGSQAMAEA